MDQHVLTARAIRLLDDDGNLSAILQGSVSGGQYGLTITSPNSQHPSVSLTIDRDSGTPSLLLNHPDGSAITLTFDEGKPVAYARSAEHRDTSRRIDLTQVAEG